MIERKGDHEANDFRPELKSTAKVPQTELNSVAKTKKASETKRDITAKDWAESLQKAVALAVDCAKSGKPKSIKQDNAMWAKLWVETESKEPRKAAFRAFRKGLPSELKFKKNRES